MTNQVVLPQDFFKRSRYMGGMWLDSYRRWGEADVTMLVAACDLRVPYKAAANALGREPTSLIHKARRCGIQIPWKWLELLPKPKRKPSVFVEKTGASAYPYIVKPDENHNTLIAVNRMVSKLLPGREDVCQDIILAILESRTSIEELSADPKAIRAFVTAFRKASFERSGYGVESMDVTLYRDDGDGKSKFDDARYQRSIADPGGDEFGDPYFWLRATT